jgi:hypothetical protein
LQFSIALKIVTQVETHRSSRREIGSYQDLHLLSGGGRWLFWVEMNVNEPDFVPGPKLYCCAEYPTLPESKKALRQ